MENPFETLGLRPAFALDPESLAQRQRELNRAVHPDRHAGKGPAERRQALSRAMDVNQAIRTLRDPALRAEALLSLLGVEPLTAASSPTDPSLLMEMMEQREALDGARRSGDAALLANLKGAMHKREQAILTDLSQAFNPLLNPPAHATGDESLAAVKRLVTELRYVQRFSEEVAAIEDEL